MPWKSNQQRKWGHTEAGKKALGGEAGVAEWDAATKGKKLPEKVSKAETPPKVKMPAPAKTSVPSVKMPKAKMMPGAFDKPSKFFKSEDMMPKHPSVRKLHDFLSTRKKR